MGPWSKLTSNRNYIIALAILFFGLAAGCSAQIFLDLPPTYPTVSTVFGLASGDFNEDGKIDLVTANDDGTISLFLGKGDGTFAVHRDFTTGANDLSVTVADINRDGHLDLVTGGSFSRNAILLGNGDGTFQNYAQLPGGTGSIPVIADFNGDGNPDLAFAGTSILIFLGNGDGTFQPPSSFFFDNSPSGIAAGDLNGDGKIDLVAGTLTKISVLPGNGDGTFQARIDFAAYEPAYITLGDLNSDGNLDVITGNVGPGLGVDTLSVFLGNGDGTLRAHQDYEARHPTSLITGDFNHDGKLDVAAQDGYSDAVSIFTGNGDGTLSGFIDYAVGFGATRGLVAGDFNRDGRTDLAATTFGEIGVLLQGTRGSYSARVDYPVGDGPIFLATADFNRDGRPDFISTNYFDQTLTLSLQKANGGFDRFDFPWFGYGQLFTGDFNGDGNPDYAVPNYAPCTMAVLLGNGDGTFQPPAYYGHGCAVGSPIVADFNNDGVLDVALAGAVLLGNGDGSFGPPITFDAGDSAGSLAAGDLNNDGVLDLVSISFTFPESTFYVIIGNGDGTFQAPQMIQIRDNAKHVFVGDFNHDGNLDAVVGHSSTFMYGYTTLMGNGDGTFQQPVFLNLNHEAPVNIGDLNGDGNLDLITLVYYSSEIGVLYGNGDGTFQPSVRSDAATAAGMIVLDDFNHDGAPDLAVANGSPEDTVSIFLNLRGTRVVAISKPNPSNSGQPVTFHVTVQPTFGSQSTPTGTVTLKDGSRTVATTALQSGRAKYRTTKLGAGTHTITIEYSGDSNYNPNSAPPITQVVNP